MTKTLGIYGAGGCGRGVMPIAAAQYGDDHDLVFIDDTQDGATINGFPALSFHRFLKLAGEKFVNIAIADSTVRQALATKCNNASLVFASIKAAENVMMHDNNIDEGAIFSPYTTVTSNVRIGRHFHCNLYSYVEHDCVIGDFVTFAPAVRCNGNVTIADGAYIGAGAVIKQGVSIGSRAVVGMGAIVTRNVAADTVVVGNPARPLKTA